MSEENQALQQQLLQKRESELENLRASVSLPVFLNLAPFYLLITHLHCYLSVGHFFEYQFS